MKTMKRFVALVAALVLCLSMMAVPANAAGITIDGSQAGVTYKVYKIFDAQVSGTGAPGDPYKLAYKLNSAWSDKNFDENAAFTTYFGLDNGYVIPEASYDDAAAVAFAAAAKKFAEDNSVALAADPVNSTGTSVNFASLTGAGYYLVVSSLGTKLALKINNGSDLTIDEKNVLPTIDKEVQENSNSAWGAANDAAYGEVVNFKITVKTEAGGEGGAANYVISDTLDANFDGIDDLKVYFNNGGADVELAEGTDYAKTTSGNTFTITFTETFLATLNAEDTITVTYSSTVKDGATMGSTGNDNTATLSYGVTTLTKTDSTKTFIYQIKGNKTDGTNNLAGAVFALMNEDGTKYLQYDGSKYNLVDNVADATKMTSDASGNFAFVGLDAGTYKLKEVTPPAGFVAPAALVTVTIGATITDGALTSMGTSAVSGASWATLTGTDVAAGAVEVELTNSTTTLPETGGMGTTVLYTAGTIMVLAAVMVLFAKKRMTAEN